MEDGLPGLKLRRRDRVRDINRKWKLESSDNNNNNNNNNNLELHSGGNSGVGYNKYDKRKKDKSGEQTLLIIVGLIFLSILFASYFLRR